MFSWKSNERISCKVTYFFCRIIIIIRHNITGSTPALTDLLSPLRLLAWFCKAKRKKKNEIIKNRKPHQNAVPYGDVNANMQCQIVSVSRIITISVTETVMKEWIETCDWMIDFTFYFRFRQIGRNCALPFYISLKNDSQGGSLSSRSFDLARPGLASPLHIGIFLQLISWCVVLVSEFVSSWTVLSSYVFVNNLYTSYHVSSYSSAFQRW